MASNSPDSASQFSRDSGAAAMSSAAWIRLRRRQAPFSCVHRRTSPRFLAPPTVIVFERATAANARKTMIVGAGRRAQRYLTAVEFVLLFTPRLVGKNAGVHPAARGIVPLLRSAYPQSAATMAIAKKDDFGQTLVRGGDHRPLGADVYTSHGRSSGRLEGSEVYRVTIL